MAQEGAQNATFCVDQLVQAHVTKCEEKYNSGASTPAAVTDTATKHRDETRRRASGGGKLEKFMGFKPEKQKKYEAVLPYLIKVWGLDVGVDRACLQKSKLLQAKMLTTEVLAGNGTEDPVWLVWQPSQPVKPFGDTAVVEAEYQRQGKNPKKVDWEGGQAELVDGFQSVYKHDKGYLMRIADGQLEVEAAHLKNKLPQIQKLLKDITQLKRATVASALLGSLLDEIAAVLSMDTSKEDHPQLKLKKILGSLGDRVDKANKDTPKEFTTPACHAGEDEDTIGKVGSLESKLEQLCARVDVAVSAAELDEHIEEEGRGKTLQGYRFPMYFKGGQVRNWLFQLLFKVLVPNVDRQFANRDVLRDGADFEAGHREGKQLEKEKNDLLQEINQRTSKIEDVKKAEKSICDERDAELAKLQERKQKEAAEYQSKKERVAMLNRQLGEEMILLEKCGAKHSATETEIDRIQRSKPEFEQLVKADTTPLNGDNTRAQCTLRQQDKLLDSHKVAMETGDQWHKIHLLQNADEECTKVVQMVVDCTNTHSRVAADRCKDENAKLENEKIQLGKIEEQLETCNTDDEDDRPQLEEQAQIKQDRIQTRHLQRAVCEEDLEILQTALETVIKDVGGRDRKIGAEVPEDLVDKHQHAIAKAKAKNLVKHLMKNLSILEQKAPYVAGLFLRADRDMTPEEIDRMCGSLQEMHHCLLDGDDLMDALIAASFVQKGTPRKPGDTALYKSMREEALLQSSSVMRSAPDRITRNMQVISKRAAHNDAPPVLSRLLADTVPQVGGVDVCKRWESLYGPAVKEMLVVNEIAGRADSPDLPSGPGDLNA